MNLAQTLQQALQHHRAGRLAQAQSLYQQVLAADAHHPEALHGLGVLAHQVGRHESAVDLIRRAIAVQAQGAYYSNLGEACRALGRLDEAIACYRQAIILQPDLPDPLNNLGNVLWEKEQLDEAIACYRQALARNADYVQAHNNLGNALKAKGELDQALACYQRVLALSPDNPEAHNNLGVALKEQGHLEQAIDHYRQALALNSDYAEAHSNLGNALKDLGQVERALAHYRQAVQLKPDWPEAHMNLAVSLLLHGDLVEGWKEQEQRWEHWRLARYERKFARPQWDGRDLRGQTILLHEEQGLGDSIQFVRYAPLVAQRGGQIILESRPELYRLMAQAKGVTQRITQGQFLPRFDCHSSLMSLPRILGTTLQSIPQSVPYIYADPKLSRQWRQKLAADESLLKVGLAWAGNPAHDNDRNRSMPLALLSSLGQVPGVSFYSLQKGPAASQAADPPPGLKLTDCTDQIKDFADTAALVAQLDLVICVDTSVAHLTGAMGQPVWILLPFAPDWRWMLDRPDTPWYPTMRLFRQARRGDWPGVVQRLAAALQDQVSKKKGRPDGG